MNLSSQDYEITKHSIEKNEELVCASLYVLHDVNEYSIIEAKQLHIEGTTDTYSSQFVHTAKINHHKGTLRCHKADILTLDGGEVHATQANIKDALSGGIFAIDVTVDSLSENVNIYASNSITINNIHGSFNTFSIDYKKIPILISRLELIKNDINSLLDELEEAQKHNHSIVTKLEAQVKQLEEDEISVVTSYKTAKIILHNTVPQGNKVTFSVNDSTFECSTNKQIYTPFYLSMKDGVMTLQPSKEVNHQYLFPLLHK